MTSPVEGPLAPGPGDDNPSRRLVRLLRAAEDLWNASRGMLARWELSPSQFQVLTLLRARPEGLSQSTMSQLLSMHRSNATGLIDRLERRGLVRREPDPRDRRAYRLALAQAGLRLLERVLPDYASAAERIWAGIPLMRQQTLLADLHQVARAAAQTAGTELGADAAETVRALTIGDRVTEPNPGRRASRPASRRSRIPRRRAGVRDPKPRVRSPKDRVRSVTEPAVPAVAQPAAMATGDDGLRTSDL